MTHRVPGLSFAHSVILTTRICNIIIIITVLYPVLSYQASVGVAILSNDSLVLGVAASNQVVKSSIAALSQHRTWDHILREPDETGQKGKWVWKCFMLIYYFCFFHTRHFWGWVTRHLVKSCNLSQNEMGSVTNVPNKFITCWWHYNGFMTE